MKQLKLLAAILALLLLAGSLSGCISVNFNGGGHRGVVQGKGDLVETTFDVDSYSKVSIRGFMKVDYSSNPSDQLKIELQENLIEYLDVHVNNGTLYVEFDERISTSSGKTPVLHLSTPALEAINVAGAIELTSIDTIKGDSFTLDVSGACEANISLDVKYLRAETSGAGELALRGTADEADIEVSGAGSINALDLQTKVANVQLSGAADMSISCSETLNTSISGAASLQYRGDPQVNNNSSGFSEVKKID